MSGSASSADLARHWALDPDATHLNHGSFGAAPRRVLLGQQSWRDRIEANTMRFFEEELPPAHEQTIGALADFIGVEVDGLVPVVNATDGVNAALRSLEFELRPGDEILVTNHGYNACTNAAVVTAARTGATVVTADVPHPPASAVDILDAVLAAVTARTRVALIDHITSPTALIFPVARLAAALEPDVAVIVDGAHAPGMLHLEVDRLGVSYYAGNCHKWLCGPKGAGLLAIREDRRAASLPTVVSHGWNRPWPGVSRHHAMFGWTGTYDPSAWLSVPTAIETMAEIGSGWDAVMAANRGLVRRGAAIVAEALGVEVGVRDDLLGSMAAVPLPDDVVAPPGAEVSRGVEPLTSYLRMTHAIEVPVVADPGAPGRRLIRLSAQLYNIEADFERLAEALVSLRR